MKRYFLVLAALVATIVPSVIAQEVINGSRQITGGISIAATAGSGGVTANLLAAKDASSPTAYVLPASGGCGSGIAATTVPAGASFQLYVVPGLLLTGVADNTITAGHILVGGTSTPGRVRDSGQTSRGAVDSTCIIGVAQESKTVGQDVLFQYDGVGTYGQSKVGTSVGSLSGAVVFQTIVDFGCGDGTLTWTGLVAGTALTANWSNLPIGVSPGGAWSTTDTAHFRVCNVSGGPLTPTIAIGATIANYYLSCSGTPTFGPIRDTLYQTQTFACSGVNPGDKPVLAWTPSADGVSASAWASSDTITVNVLNYSGASQTPTGRFEVTIAK